MLSRLILLILLTGTAHAFVKRDTALDIKAKYGDLKDGCFPRPGSDGCRCTFTDKEGKEQAKLFENKAECVKSTVIQTVENKAKLNEEFKQTFGALREGCFPRPKQGCRCTEKNGEGTKLYNTQEECTGPLAADKENKANLNEEFKTKYGGLKENCFPRPGKGCRCTEKNAQGNEETKLYDTDAQCKVVESECTETECKIRDKREAQRSQSPDRPSQNVRDPVREKAQANFAAVINELKDKFRGLKEGCFPRPKGCMCVIGKNVDGREITERRMKDSDCKCQPGERGPGCPAAAARL